MSAIIISSVWKENKNALKVLSVDIENLVLKFLLNFPTWPKSVELKECYEFCEAEFREVIRHVPPRWLSLSKAVERLLTSWSLFPYFGTWRNTKSQVISSLPPMNSIHIFIHYFMPSFQEAIGLLRTGMKKRDDTFFGMNVKFAVREDYSPPHLVAEAL